VDGECLFAIIHCRSRVLFLLRFSATFLFVSFGAAAVEVVEIIRKKGGRFLRRCDVPGPRGEAYYYDIGA